MSRFGVLLDLSRNSVMKVEQIKRFIDCMQKMNYNTNSYLRLITCNGV